ncbi:MAG: SlyX family protein [Gammaproteobacteria bacterium]|jgi:SlyX protein|nr:SlyX family protein [Gammaproteobacteria bacterium]
MSDDLTVRLDELETRLAFQDDTIEALNEVVSRQELALEKLQRAVELLARRQADLAASMPGEAEADQPPPHY